MLYGVYEPHTVFPHFVVWPEGATEKGSFNFEFRRFLQRTPFVSVQLILFRVDTADNLTANCVDLKGLEKLFGTEIGRVTVRTEKVILEHAKPKSKCSKSCRE